MSMVMPKFILCTVIAILGTVYHRRQPGKFWVRHKKALQLQHNSQLLLLIEINQPETTCIIPGKLFEYLAAYRPIIAFGPSGSDVSTILKETNHGKYFAYTDVELKETILSFYSDYKNNNLKVLSKGIDEYRRVALTEKMAIILKNT